MLQVLAFDKDTTEVIATISLQNYKRTDGALWDSMAVGECDFETDRDCVYLIRKTATGVEILKFTGNKRITTLTLI